MKVIGVNVKNCSVKLETKNAPEGALPIYYTQVPRSVNKFTMFVCISGLSLDNLCNSSI